MLPEICVRFFGNSRISARKVTLLPDPDSPSRPEHFPLAEGKAQIVHGMHGTLAGKANVEAIDFDEMGHVSCGSLS